MNELAPEHVEIMTSDDEAVAAQIRHAGAIFFGAYTPEAVGDYLAGPNHVLPTGRTARFSSALGVYDFVKRTSLLRYSEEAFVQLRRMSRCWLSVKGLRLMRDRRLMQKENDDTTTSLNQRSGAARLFAFAASRLGEAQSK